MLKRIDGTYIALKTAKSGQMKGSRIKNALVRLIGPHPAEKILEPGALLSPDQALDIGLVDELGEGPKSAVARAVAWCEHLLSLLRNAMLITRHMSREALRSFLLIPSIKEKFLSGGTRPAPIRSMNPDKSCSHPSRRGPLRNGYDRR